MTFYDAYIASQTASRSTIPAEWLSDTQWIDTGYRPATRYSNAGDWRIEYESIFKPTKTVRAKKDTGIVAEDYTLDVSELL